MPDEIDLKRAFDRAAGLTPNAPAALAGLRTRIRKAHQRRALARGGAGLLGVVAVGGVIMNIGGDGSGTEVASTGAGATDTSLLTSTALASATTTIASSSSAPLSSADATASSTASTQVPTTSAPTTIGTSIPGTTVFVPTTRPSVGEVAVFTAEGGTIVVDYTSSAMTLTSVAANPGWTVAESRAQPDDIEVRFENEDRDDSRIRVRLVDGQPEQDDDRRGSSDGGSTDDSGNDDSSGPGSGDDG